jgi:hypothetical protein
MTITADTITADQIRALRTEARAAGDSLLAEWCDVALAYGERYDSVGFPLTSPGTGLSVTRTEAREVCADAIRAAAAMLDD